MSSFHFLRPWWLLALIPVAILAWRLWIALDSTRAWRSLVAPHLLQHLLIGQNTWRWASPLPILVLCWTLAVFALAGPTWRREPAPFADDQAALVIVLKVTPSMLNTDIQPTRLTRGIQKIHDLLVLRPGARTAFVAYSGTTHQVVPLTNDGEIIDSFASNLDPQVMPVEGDCVAKALDMAEQILRKSQDRGWILWISDAVAADQLSSLPKMRESGLAPLGILAMSTDGPEQDSVKKAASALNADLVRVTPDDVDVRHLARNTRFSDAPDAGGERWRDAGYWLVPLLALVHLAWFRSGWMLPERAVA